MSTSRADPPRWTAYVAGLAVSTTLVACGHDAPASAPPAAGALPVGVPSTAPPAGDHHPAPTVPDLPDPRDLVADVSRQLDTRAAALLQHDEAAFDRTLAGAAPGFVTAQEGYYANLAQLPVEALTYDPVPSSLVRTGRSYWINVEVSFQLAGYDAVPVSTPDRFRFSPTGPHGGYRLSSTTDAAWEAAHGVHGQPWDVEPVQVRTRDGVLAVFDASSVTDAAAVMRSLAQGARAVQAQVPYGWDGRVVVDVLSDDSFIAGLGDVPGGDPQNLDGVAFTVPASVSDPRVAATRVALAPASLAATPAALAQLVRHELTHVAVGAHDYHAPLWLSEGLAEWVSVQPMPRSAQEVPAAALAVAASPHLTMPLDSDFNGPDAAVNYTIGWWACEYLSATYGTLEPWLLLDALGQPGATTRSVLHDFFRLSPDQLARRGGRLLVATYRTGSPPRRAH